MMQLMASKEKGLGLGGPAPSRVRSAEKALAAARRAAEAAAGAEAPEALEARYGLPTAQSTASIDRVLQSGMPGGRAGSQTHAGRRTWGGSGARSSWLRDSAVGLCPSDVACLMRLRLPPAWPPAAGDPGLVGVFAQLATVDDPALSAVLATNFRGVLPTVVLADKAARQRLSALLAQRKLAPPDMLPLTMLVASAAKAGDSPGFAGASEHAHVLQRAACRGTDPPLALPLPHTKAINVLRERGEQHAGIRLREGCVPDVVWIAACTSRTAEPAEPACCPRCLPSPLAADGVGMAASDWPIGCLGYACNLVRPLHRGHRASLLANLLGGALVFERLKEAEEYREFLSMVGGGSLRGRRTGVSVHDPCSAAHRAPPSEPRLLMLCACRS